MSLLMYHTVVQLGQLGLVPTVGSTHEVTRDALKTVYVVAAATGTFVHNLLGILVTAIHATVEIGRASCRERV